MRSLRSRAFGAALLAVLSAPLTAGQTPEASPDTLRLGAVLDALAETPALRAARLGADALAVEAEAADTWPNPTLGVEVQPRPMRTAHGAQRSAWRVAQMLPWPGTLARRRAVAEAGAVVAEAEADVLAADLALEAQEAYVTLARVQAVEALVRRYRARLDAFAEAAAVRYEVGRGPQAAILRAQLESGRLDTRLLTLDAERHLALATLARLLDRPDLTAGAVAVEPVALPGMDAALVALARRLRPETAVLDAAMAQTEAEVALAEIGRYPEIGASLTYMDVASTVEPATPHSEATRTAGTDALAVGLTVRVPLDRGSRRARVEAARVRAAQVEARREALATAIATAVEAHLHHAHHELAALELYRTRLLPQAETTVASALAAYTTGQADFLALLDAERARFELRVAEAEAEARYLTAAARLARALGVPSLYDLAELSDD